MLVSPEFIGHAFKRGVDPYFALHELACSSQDIWYPMVSEVKKSRVLFGKNILEF